MLLLAGGGVAYIAYLTIQKDHTVQGRPKVNAVVLSTGVAAATSCAIVAAGATCGGVWGGREILISLLG
jgi:hypothetical protein